MINIVRLSLNRTWKKLTLKQAMVLFILSFVFINEYVVYVIQEWRWAKVRPLRHSEDEVRLLLVGDPQIQGYNGEPPTIIGSITRWDSDRYLRSTFRQASNYVKPDAVLFLGDLIDEGSQAQDEHYSEYVDRFKEIFKSPTNVENIYVSGDNDVGGEGGDFKTKVKVQRYEKYFGNSVAVQKVKFLDFIKADYDFITSWNDTADKAKHLVKLLSGRFRIILNHHGILERFKRELYPIVKMFSPNFIFSAHLHLPTIHICTDCTELDKEKYQWEGNTLTDVPDQIKFDLNSPNLVEIIQPTCSYRMGVPEMAYGVAVIDKNGALEYTLLWLPSRYIQLYLYLALTICVIVVVLFKLCISKIWPNSRKQTFYGRTP
ncbi:unnamed protein product [Owenia fusiformis]|uniref:Uncharacterized protein n=1 Tax=Owenia fusiformis TaxID=6347 RepID=A0A8J1U5H5_OWEFU|nr:unnamed protein product [Owenia fusiformis]